jgi:hypothetical protein
MPVLILINVAASEQLFTTSTIMKISGEKPGGEERDSRSQDK